MAALIDHTDTTPDVVIPQYGRGRVLATWAAAALPMAALAWVVTPRLAHHLAGPSPLGKALILCLGAGLLWQLVLVLALVAREQGTLRWPVLRRALWLQAPNRDGRRGGRLWWVLLPAILLFASEEAIPTLPHPAGHDFGTLLDSTAGQALLQGGLFWPIAVLTLMLLNTMFGEELLFRGLLLPRMSDAFGRADWLVNGLLFAGYHLHQPWTMPAALVDTFALAWPSRRYRSALMGIIVHSSQTVFLGTAVIVVASR